ILGQSNPGVQVFEPQTILDRNHQTTTTTVFDVLQKDFINNFEAQQMVLFSSMIIGEIDNKTNNRQIIFQ
ncbi:hypothetical protein BGZ46_004746, partial [Entomortierella lignicola]